MRKYLMTSQLSATRGFDGGLFYVLSGYFLQLATMVILLLLWRSLADQGADLGGLSLPQLLTYTLLASVLSEQLNIVTPATTAFWEGSIISRYTRPMPVLMQMGAETVGGWLPGLLLYSLPMLLLSPLLGVSLRSLMAHGPVVLVSLLLSVSLGFAMDFMFASLVIYVKNASYTAYYIRQAIIKLFSGALIPFALLPWGVGKVLELLPFGSVASAPLLVAIGSDSPYRLLALQLFWNAVLWPLALLTFKKSEERMVSYGG